MKKTALLVVAPYYLKITDFLKKGAYAALEAEGFAAEELCVPGALEIAPAIACRKSDYGCFIALGCVMRGETTHYETVATQSAAALAQLSLSECLAIGNGILTTENEWQALQRANPFYGDKGGEAARAALALVKVRHG